MLRQHALPLGVVPISLGFDARDAESRGFGDDELVVGSDPWSALVKLWRLRNTISVESASASASDSNDITKTVASSASGGPRHVAIRVKLSASSTATWIVPVQVDTSLASTNGIVSKQLWNRLSALTSGVDDDELADFGSSVTLDVELEVAQPVPLQEAVFDVDDSAAYARLCDDSSAFISSKIVRMGESIDVTVMRGEHGEESQSITAHSTSTSPVRQGIITPATRIIIRKSEQLERTQQNEGVATTFDNSADLILAADFLAQQALSFSIDSDLDDIAMDEDEANDSVAESDDSHLWQKRSHSMSAHVRPDHIESGLLLPRPGADVDESRIVIVTLDTLARLQAASGDWVYISNENSNSNSNSSSNSSNPGSLYRAYAICPGLLPTSSSSNSSSNGSLLNGSVWMTTAQMMSIGVNPTDGVSIRTIASSENIPSAARVLTLARVATPPSSTMSSASGSGRLPEEACLSALKNWLATKPRQLSVGDVISLQVDQSAESAKAKLVRPGDKWEEIAVPSSSSSSLSAPSPVQSKSTVETIYYKATALEPFPASATSSVSDSAFAHHGFYSVDPAQTAVTQSGTIRTRFSRQPPSSQTSSDPAINRLTKLFESSLHPLARTQELTCSILLHGASGSGKHTSVLTAAKTCGLHVYRVHVPRFVRESDDKTIAALETYFETAAQYAPCVFVLTGIEMLTRDGRGSAGGGGGGGDPNAPMSPVVRALEKCISTLSKQASFAERDNWPVAVVGITSSALDRLPSGLSSCFKFNIGIQVPAEPARQAMLTSLLSKVTVAPDVSIKQLATQTASFVTSDLNNVVSKASLAAWERAVSACTHSTLLVRDVALAGSVVCMADITSALAAARSMLSDTLGVPKIPNVTWDDVGGLASVKRDILDMVQLPMERPDLFANGVKKRSGVLLYGPPGTGKTLLAKAVATSCSLNFFSVKGPELLNMYIGESEANVRRVFQRARDARPCVVFFDELDSLAPRRGQQGDSGGVMDRIVSQLLAELDGMSSAPSNDDEDGKDGSGSGGGSGGDVFVIGATNRPDLLDPALLRPGRFDKMLYLGVSDDHDSQLKIIQALTRKFNLDPELDLAEIAEMCPFNYTGADMYALCSDAMLKAMISRVNAVDAKIAEINSQGIHEPGHPVPMTPQYFLDHLATPADIQVVVTKDDFVAALDELVPSVSMEELDRYQEIRRKFTPEGQVADKPKEQQQQQQQAVQKQQQPKQYQKVAVLSTDDRRVSVSPEIAPTFVDDDEEEEDIDGEFYNDPAEKAKGKRPMLPSNDI